MAFSTGCDSGSVSHVCVSICECDPDGVPVANRTFSDDNSLNIFGSQDLAPIDKVCRSGASFN